MKVLSLTELGKFELQDRPIPEPGIGEVLLKVGAAGICGSDIPRAFVNGPYHYPIVLGHEFSGQIVATGTGVKKELIGRKAAIFPLIPCNKCDFCKERHYAKCTHYSYFGSRQDGGFSEYVTVPEFNLVLLNDDADLREAAMLEPAVVGLHVMRRAHLDLNDTVVIYGTGPIGIMIARWAALYGAKKVLLIDIDEKKIEFCHSLGFTDICNASQIDPVEWVMLHTDGYGADVCIEGSGSSTGFINALLSCRVFGKVLMLGNPHADISIPREAYDKFMRKEAQILGVFNSIYSQHPHDEWKDTAAAIQSGKLKVSDLITHAVPMAQLSDLIDLIRENKVPYCKGMMVM
ncbi:galactitol-1-phosphate 5-dehydrogenase [Citrobacter sp. NCU1]|uniref:galactitol-1-phosphate 5-dehydrogenase n=1 Tax=Citrobacter sp. NCU1 TaxID=2026683 RepID=UPI001391B2EA|nr:galactitol-1-phosphate 5-dehydrogenase [Citrobacter sp. NCU1]NDO83774.1 galactitol-1-phosphate 5-dehydrogenase [Citrobacter sp. NCU1]